MHQAIEAKEKVEIKAENQTLATITLQNYFRLYTRLSGMTGTAETEAAEFWNTYKLHVVPIPTNRPMVRSDRTDLIYKTEEAKFEAVAEDIAERHEKGQPVLVGTTSVERSEYLSKLLVKMRVPHNVLNAKHHEKESAIVAEAGHSGAVTVATNMAGRGTDIMLGGNPDHLAEESLRAKGLDPVETPHEWTVALPEALERAKDEVRAEAEEVREAGGLYVLGTERHESRRIDNQLRGRSGRQGDPGESRFYLSLGDELMRRFNAQFVERVMVTMRVPDDQPIEAKMVTRAIKSAQTQVEQQNFEARKNLLKYDEVMNQQRKEIYANRMRVLQGEDLRDQVDSMIEEVVGDYVEKATAGGYAEDWDHHKLWTALKELYPITLKWEDLVEDMEDHGDDLTAENLLDAVLDGHPPRVRRARGVRQQPRPRPRRPPDRRRHAPPRAAGDARRAGPQVARAPVRDGLPQGRHRPACHGAARPADRVPAGGLRHVQHHARRPQGRLHHAAVPRPGRGAGARAARCPAGAPRPGSSRPPPARRRPRSARPRCSPSRRCRRRRTRSRPRCAATARRASSSSPTRARPRAAASSPAAARTATARSRAARAAAPAANAGQPHATPRRRARRAPAAS